MARDTRLQDEIDVLQHELRRARDDLERMSGPRHSLEKRIANLVENIRLCERELIEIQADRETRGAGLPKHTE